MEDILRLGQFDSKAIIPLGSVGPGIYLQKLAIVGNSLLSTVYIQSIDPGTSVHVEYFDYGVGADAGEIHNLNSHEVFTVAGTSDRILVSNIHDKPTVKATVSGGNATFGVYATVVLSSASDVDSALHKEDEPVILSADKGIPTMIYDVDAGVWKFNRGTDGIQDVHIVGNVQIEASGSPVFADAATVTTPGSIQTILSYTVPAAKTLNIFSVTVICRQESTFQIYGDSLLIGSGRTGAASPNVNFGYVVPRSFIAGKLIEIKATARNGSSAADIEGYLQGTLS